MQSSQNASTCKLFPAEQHLVVDAAPPIVHAGLRGRMNGPLLCGGGPTAARKKRTHTQENKKKVSFCISLTQMKSFDHGSYSDIGIDANG